MKNQIIPMLGQRITSAPPALQRRAGLSRQRRPCHLLFAAFSALNSVLLTWFFTAPAPAASFRGLGDLPGGNFASWASATNSAGDRVVVGTGTSSSGQRAFRWTEATGMESLGMSPGDTASSANAVSADGLVVGGGSGPSSVGGAVRWTQATGMLSIGDLPGGSVASIAQGVSAHGEVIVGENSSSLANREAFRWTSGEGMTGLGDLPGGGVLSTALAVSSNGLVGVGWEKVMPASVADAISRALNQQVTYRISGASMRPGIYAFFNGTSMGLLQNAGTTGPSPGKTDGVKSRYRLLPGTATSPAASARYAAATNLPFGPVMELVLPFSAPCRMQYFQFHTGNVFPIGDGPGDKTDHAEDYRRAEETGVRR